MDFDKFYNLANPNLPAALHVHMVRGKSENEKPIDMPKLRKILTGEQVLRAPLQFCRLKGRLPMDHITTAFVMIHLFSNRFFECLEGNHFTGWSTIPVSIFGSDGKEISGYKGLSVKGKCGPIINSKSYFSMVPPGVFGIRESKVLMGLYFDEKTYDGSDIFIPDGTSYIIMTEKVKNELERANISNIAFEPLSKEINYLATLEMED